MREILIRHLAGFLLGCCLDLAVGDPHGFPHPVIAIGKLISYLERKLYPPEGAYGGNPEKSRRSCTARGALLCVLTAGAAVLITAAVMSASCLLHPCLGVLAEALLTCCALAAGSLYDESMKVRADLVRGSLREARADLSMIVGRDTCDLDRDAVCRAAVETVAENTSDGVIAPLLCAAVGGPVLAWLYKSVNTMDSMLGYRNERYLYFGRAAARLDDAVNYIPSRVSALLMIGAAAVLGACSGSCSAREAYRIWRRDRRKHKSPNSAQTESACAGALGIVLGGPSRYQGVTVRKPFIGDDRRAIEPEDIRRACRLMFVSELLAVLLLSAAACLLSVLC